MVVSELIKNLSDHKSWAFIDQDHNGTMKFMHIPSVHETYQTMLAIHENNTIELYSESHKIKVDGNKFFIIDLDSIDNYFSKIYKHNNQ